MATDTVNPRARPGGNSVAADQLRSFVDRIERLNEEKKALADDITEIFKEAKGNGFDTKILRKLIAIRKLDVSEWQEQETLLDIYLDAVGMFKA